MVKKVFIGLAAAFGLFLVAVIVLPFVVDANQFKPQIVKAVQDNLNADFEVGDLKFSLWGGLHIQISKLVLSEQGSHGSRPIFAMNDAKLEIPISSILGGKPDITLAVKKPEINVVVGKDGKMNVMKIMKPATGAPKSAEASKGGNGAGAAAGLAFDLSFDIQDGHVVYADEKKNTRTDLTGLDLSIRRFGLNQPFDFSFKTDLNAKEVKSLVLHGPILLQGKAGIFVKPEGLDRVDVKSELDMSGLTVKYAELFNKVSGVPLKVEVDVSTNEHSLRMNEIKFIANDASVSVRGTVVNFDNPNLDVSIQSNKFVFDHWQNILAPLKDFDMKGSAQLSVKVLGAPSKLGYSGKASLGGTSLKAPGIVPRVSDLKANLAFSNDGVTLSDAGLKLGASDLQFSGSVRNFTKPVINFNLRSELMDVDALFPQKSTEQIKAEEKQSEAEADKPGMTDAQIEATVAGPVAMIQKNPLMRAMDFTARIDMRKVVVHKAEINKLNAEAGFKGLVLTLKKASAQTFSGTVNFSSSIDLRGKDVAYTASGDVAGLDINAAVTNQMPVAKDSIFGKVTAKFNVTGAGVTKTKAKQLLKGSGHFNVANGSFSALSALKQLNDKLASLPANIRQSIGGASFSDRFRQLRSDFNIANGKINIVNMVADMEGPNNTLLGQGWVDFDMNNSITGKFVMPSNDVPSELRYSDGRLAVPFEIGCKIKAPCIKTEATLNPILQAKGKQELRKAVQKIDNPQVQQLLKKLPF